MRAECAGKRLPVRPAETGTCAGDMRPSLRVHGVVFRVIGVRCPVPGRQARRGPSLWVYGVVLQVLGLARQS